MRHRKLTLGQDQVVDFEVLKVDISQ